MSTFGWFYPTTIIQLPAEDEHLIPWKSLTPELSFPIMTTKPLIHIAGTGGPGPGLTDVRNRTTALEFTDFQIPVGTTVTGIELLFDVDRLGRISDAEIILIHNGEFISGNKTNFEQDEGGHLLHFNDKTYGGAIDLWGAELTPEMLADPSFGVHIRMQSHPYFPHNATPIIRQVALRYYSA